MSRTLQRFVLRLFAFAVLSNAFTSYETASAALVAFDSYIGYQTAAMSIVGLTNTEGIIDFESASPGNSLSSIGDITFSSNFGSGVLRVWVGGQDTVSPDNYSETATSFPPTPSGFPIKRLKSASVPQDRQQEYLLSPKRVPAKSRSPSVATRSMSTLGLPF